MRKVTVRLIGLLSLLALAACQPAIAPPAAAPRATHSPTPAPVPVSLFSLSQQRTVVALDPANGSVRWQHPLGGEVPNLPTTLLAAQDTVYVASGLALNAGDGKERWQISNPGQLVAMGNGIVLTIRGVRPTLFAWRTTDGKLLWSLLDMSDYNVRIVGNVVYAIGQPDQTLYALGAQDGKVRWQFHQTGIVLVEAVTQDAVYVTVDATDDSAHTLFALNPSDGRERWHLSSPNGNFFIGPAEVNGAVNGAVYVALDGYDDNGCTTVPRTSPPGTIYAFSADDGKPLWHTPPPLAGNVFAIPAVDQSVVYSADHQSAFAFNTADGQQLWSSQILQSGDAHLTFIEQPIIGASLVYLTVMPCGFNRQPTVSLWALNKSDGHAVWHYQEPQPSGFWSGPLAVNGSLYVTTPTGNVAALDGSDGTQIWQSTGPLTNLVTNAA